MGNEVILALKPENFLEVVARAAQKEKTMLDFVKSPKIVKQKHTIQRNFLPNEHGEYTFHEQHLNDLTKFGSIDFYHQDEKIACVSLKKNTFLFVGLTQRQINFFVDLNLDNAEIEAIGSLCIDANLYLHQSLKLRAQGLYLSGKIQSATTFIDVVSMTGILAEVTTRELKITCAYLYQNHQLKVADHLDINTKIYQHDHTAYTEAKALRLIAEQSEISGKYWIQSKAFIACNTVLFGSAEAQSTVQFDGESYFHFGYLECVGDTHFTVKAVNENQIVEFIVDDRWIIHSSALIQVQDTYLSLNELDNQGVIKISNVIANIDNVSQKGVFFVSAVELNVSQHFKAFHSSETKFISTKLTIAKLTQMGIVGKFALESSFCTAENWIFSAEFLMRENSELEIDTLSFLQDAGAEIESACLTISENAYFHGKTRINQSSITTGFLKLSHPKTEILATKLHGNRIQIQNAIVKQNCIISTKRLELQKSLDISDCIVRAENLFVQSKEGKFSGVVLQTNCLRVEGGDKKEDLVFDKCQLVFGKIFQYKYISVRNSFLTMLDDTVGSQQINGHLLLDNSRFLCPTRVATSLQSEITLVNFAKLEAQSIINTTKISAENSRIQTHQFIQRNGKLIANNSFVYTQEHISLKNSKVSLKNNSILVGKKIFQQSKMRLKQRSLVVANDLFSSASTGTVKVDESAIKTGKYVTFGRDFLDRSALSADELHIYQQFSAKNYSITQITSKTSIAPDAKLVIQKSSHKTKNITSFGKAKLCDAIVEAQEVFLWDDARLSLQGKTGVKSDFLYATSKIEVKRNGSESASAVMPTINTENLYLAKQAHVHGEDLKIETKSLINDGEVDLTSLYARGENFLNNHRLTVNDSMFLGFDGSIYNAGVIRGNDIKIHGDFFNFFGYLSAKKTLAISGLVNFNFGLISANNYTSNNILSLNAGFSLPNLSADPKYIFSTSNLMNFGKQLLISVLPKQANLINLAFMMPGFVSSGKNLYQMYQRYDLKTLRLLRRHEIVPLICQIKDLAMFGYGAFNTCQNATSEFSDLFSSTEQSIPTSVKGIFSDVDWWHTSKQAAGIFGGTHTDNSLVQVNVGADFAINTTKMSLFHLNMGVNQSLYSHHIQSYALVNQGISTGEEANFRSWNTLVNNGYMAGYGTLSVQANKMINGNSGDIYGDKTNIQLDYLEQNGSMHLRNGKIQVTYQWNDTGATTLENMLLTGAFLEGFGSLQAENTSIQMDAIHFTAQSEEHLTDVQIKIQTLVDESHLSYESSLSIEAEQYQHAGDLSGSGMLGIKATSMVNTETATLTADKIAFEIGSLEQKGSMDVQNGLLKVGHFENNGRTKLNEVLVEGDALQNAGRFDASNTAINVTDVQLTSSAEEHLADVSFQSSSIRDDSQIFYKGVVATETKDYQHTGDVEYEEEQNLEQPESFYVKSDTAVLKGSGSIKHGVYDIGDFKDNVAFVSGTGSYANYQFGVELDFSSKNSFILNSVIERDCDLKVTATNITTKTNYDRDRTLRFISTEGDIDLLSDIHAANVYLNSAANIYTNHTTNADGFFYTEAKGGYYNWGGMVNAENIFVSAKEIINVTKGSEAAKKSWGFAFGSDGILNGRDQNILDATGGNIENHGGIIRAGEYAQLTATGDIINTCNVHSKHRKHDVVKEFDSGLTSGGNGTSTNGLGLYVKANGKVISDASDFVSNGDNYIDGVQGVEFKARSHTYVSEDKKKSSWGGFEKKHIIETKTTIKGSQIHSNNGRNIIYSEEGGVNTIAAAFTSPGGTDIYAKGDVKLYSLKTRDRRYESKESWWGLDKSKRDEYIQSSTPTLFLDNGTTRIHSAQGNVDARGALFIGEGDLEIKACKRILFGRDILDQEIYEDSRTFGFSAPGMGAWQTLSSGGSLWSAVSAEDATLAKLNSLGLSSNNTEFLTNASNLGINLYNSSSSILRGLANDNLSGELLSRYGLGGADGFNPSFTISYTVTKTTTKYQTLGAGGVDRNGNVSLQAGEGIDLENGVVVHAGKNMDVDAPEVRAHSAELNSSFDQTSESVNVGVTLAGNITDVGGSYSKNHSDATAHVNAQLSADGNMNLHDKDGAMKIVELDGANIEAGSLSGDIEHLSIIDKQDISHTKSESFSASTSGNVSVYVGEGTEKITNQHSGIHTKGDLNTEENPLHVGTVDMVGGKILSDGKNNFAADKVNATNPEDSKQYSGLGISVNVNDLARVTGNAQPTNTAGEQAIAVGTLTIDKVNYQAPQTPVIFGEQGNHLKIDEITGNLNTSSQDGRTVSKDESMHVNVDVPLTNQNYLQQAQQNVHIVLERWQEKNAEEKSVLESDKTEFFVDPVLISDQTKPVTDQDDDTSIDHADSDQNDTDAAVIITDSDIEGAISHLTFISPEDQQAYELLIAQAEDEIKSTGVISIDIENQLRNKIQDALVETLKARSEATYEAVMEAISGYHPAINIYTNAKGAVITFAFNLALSSETTTSAQFKDAAANTLSDIVFGITLSRVAGVAEGPVGWAFTGFEILDGLTYDQVLVDSLYERSISGMQLAQQQIKEDHSADAWAQQYIASQQFEAAIQMQAVHQMLNIGSYIAAGFNWAWNHTVGSLTSTQNSSSLLPQASASSLTSQSDRIPVSNNRYSFFMSPKPENSICVSVPELTDQVRQNKF